MSVTAAPVQTSVENSCGDIRFAMLPLTRMYTVQTSAAPSPSAVASGSRPPVSAPASTSTRPVRAIASAPTRLVSALSRPSAIAATVTNAGNR